MAIHHVISIIAHSISKSYAKQGWSLPAPCSPNITFPLQIHISYCPPPPESVTIFVQQISGGIIISRNDPTALDGRWLGDEYGFNFSNVSAPQSSVSRAQLERRMSAANVDHWLFSETVMGGLGILTGPMSHIGGGGGSTWMIASPHQVAITTEFEGNIALFDWEIHDSHLILTGIRGNVYRIGNVADRVFILDFIGSN